MTDNIKNDGIVHRRLLRQHGKKHFLIRKRHKNVFIVTFSCTVYSYQNHSFKKCIKRQSNKEKHLKLIYTVAMP